MAKAILVMDMPDYCNDCYAMNMSLSGRFCRAAEESLPVKAERPDWCPLRELPEKMEVCGKYPQLGKPVPSYRLGWNACLDKILKTD